MGEDQELELLEAYRVLLREVASPQHLPNISPTSPQHLPISPKYCT